MKHLALIPITGLVLLTIAGCATSPDGTGANNNRVTNVTTNASDTNGVFNLTGETNNTTSDTGNATSSRVNGSGTTANRSKSTSAATNASKFVKEAGVPFSGIGNVSSVKMFGSDNGWAASNRGVYRTSDGGLHWIRVLRGNAAFMTNGQSIFVNKDTAYAILPISNSKSHMFVTHDGGEKWRSSVMDFGAQTVIQISFVNSSVGWVMTAPGGAAGPMEPVAIHKTIDGGLHTQLSVPAPTKSAKSHGLPQAALKTGIHFDSSTQGWITANSWGNDIWLYETVDGGSTWINRTITLIPKPLKPYLGGEQQPGNPTLFSSLQGALPVDFNGGGFCLYVTKDGGKQWRFTQPLLTKNNVKYDVLDATHVFVSAGRTLYETKDLGQNWFIVSKSAPAGVSLDFANSSVGYAVGKYLWKTTNGGNTWSVVQ